MVNISVVFSVTAFKGSEFKVTRKVWFQVGVGVLLTLLIIKYFIEIHWIFHHLSSS